MFGVLCCQVGVPRTIATTLTIPVRVTKHNLCELTVMVNNGPFKHPGARFVIRSDGSRIDLRFSKDPEHRQLKAGFIVERHLVDGDTVLFNRQPSLHKVWALALLLPGVMLHGCVSSTSVGDGVWWCP